MASRLKTKYICVSETGPRLLPARWTTSFVWLLCVSSSVCRGGRRYFACGDKRRLRGHSRLFNLLNRVKSDAVGALWDIHHPYRFMNEKPETTVQNLGGYIKYTHIKDSVIENGKVVYKMMGEGDLPIDDIILALRSINFEGYISLEWLKR